jgi:phosphatidate phosphatase APP1
MKSLNYALILMALLSACNAPVGPLSANRPAALSAASLQAQAAKRLQIRMFRSYGNEGTVHVKARVMKPENQRPEQPDDSSLMNFWRNLTALTVKEVAGVKIELRLNGKSLSLISDEEGMIQAPAQAFGPLPAGIHLLEAALAPGQNYTAPTVSEKVVIQDSRD